MSKLIDLINDLTNPDLSEGYRFRLYCISDDNLKNNPIIDNLVDNLYEKWKKYILLLPNLVDDKNNIDYGLDTFYNIIPLYNFLYNLGGKYLLFMSRYKWICNTYCNEEGRSKIKAKQIKNHFLDWNKDFQLHFISNIGVNINGLSFLKLSDLEFNSSGFYPSLFDINIFSNEYIFTKDYEIRNRNY